MEQGPSWETDSHSAGQEIPYILWDLRVYYHHYSSLPLDPVLSHLKPVHTITPFNIHFNIILPSTPRSSKWFFASDFPILHVCCMSSLSYPPWLENLGEEYKVWSSSLCTSVSSPRHFVLRKPSIFVPPLRWQTMSYVHIKQQVQFLFIYIFFCFE